MRSFCGVSTSQSVSLGQPTLDQSCSSCSLGKRGGAQDERRQLPGMTCTHAHARHVHDLEKGIAKQR